MCCDLLNIHRYAVWSPFICSVHRAVLKSKTWNRSDMSICKSPISILLYPHSHRLGHRHLEFQSKMDNISSYSALKRWNCTYHLKIDAQWCCETVGNQSNSQPHSAFQANVVHLTHCFCGRFFFSSALQFAYTLHFNLCLHRSENGVTAIDVPVCRVKFSVFDNFY